MDGVLIVGFIVLGIYKLFELFVKKNERLALIEKLPAFLHPDERGKAISFPAISFMKQDDGSWPLRISLLLIGIGLGCLLAFFLQYTVFDFPVYDADDWQARREVEHIRFVLYFSLIAVFGGLSLFGAYLIERRQSKERADSKE